LQKKIIDEDDDNTTDDEILVVKAPPKPAQTSVDLTGDTGNLTPAASPEKKKKASPEKGGFSVQRRPYSPYPYHPSPCSNPAPHLHTPSTTT
jgi:hypothetical protein